MRNQSHAFKRSTAPKVLCLALTILTRLSAVAADGIVLADSLTAGDTVSGALQIGRRIIAIPAGNWRVIHKAERNSSNDGQGSPMLSLAFDEIVDGRLKRTLALTATKYSKNVTWLDEPCKSKADAYWIDDRSRGTNDQFCIRVSYQGGIVDGARGEAFESWARGIISRGIGYSPEMPGVRITRYTSYDYLQMTVSFDPSVSGIERSKRPERQFNDWNGIGIEERPQHAKFYAALKAWATLFATAADRAFSGDKTLAARDYGEPSLPPK